MINRINILFLLTFLAALSLGAAPSAWAIDVPVGSYSFDGNLPGSAFVSFDGTSFSTPVALPTATMGVTLNPGSLHQDYPVSSFQILSGFDITVGSTYAFHPGIGVLPDPGDAIFGSIDAGEFEFIDTIGQIIHGTFTSATFTSAVGATAASISTSDVNGLTLTAGPAFTFDSTYVSSIDAFPTGFSISLSSIPAPVSVSLPGAMIGDFIPVTLDLFGLSTGSSVVSGKVNVVPEPGTFALLGFGLIALATPAIRRLRRKAQR